ncbi:MAG TPA: SDR family oxidoreductase [Bryobacteraceae bacterium]|nr:SDR family oxidoreductase [Bryobacteraceae bacterium]HPT26879.1 SDR family oxidoreductase [Bryobacteraceae bacterium]
MEASRPLAVVTGASSGLGETYARVLASRGFDLLLVARRLDRLEVLCRELELTHSIHAEPLCADLADESQTGDVAKRIESEPNLALLINNAGFGSVGYFHETGYARQVEMVKVHVLATMRLTRAALPGMIARAQGGIINVSSVAGYFRSAGNASYCSTKGWVKDFSEALWLEMDKLGSPVAVQALCPGFTYTEFHDTIGVKRELVPKWLWMDAEFVVRTSLDALAARKLFVVPGWPYKLGVLASKLMPDWLRLKVELKSPHKRTEA